MNAIASVTEPRFTASATREGADILVRLVGEADTNAKPRLEPFLDAVHDAAATSPGVTVVVDFQSLKFMSSSCFQNFVVWLGRVREADETNQYRIAFLANAEQHWQRRSLSALGCFAPDQVVVR
jgi:hypothetical protein